MSIDLHTKRQVHKKDGFKMFIIAGAFPPYHECLCYIFTELYSGTKREK